MLKNYSLKKNILILVLFLSTQFFSQKSLLDSAYQSQSKELLEKYLENWQKETKDTSSIINDTTKMVNAVFEAFYFPNQLSHYNGNGVFFGNENCKYIILPNELKFSICNESSPLLSDSLKAYKGFILDQLVEQSKNQKINVLSNFRPHLKLDNSIALYLTPSYKTDIYNFLGPTRLEGDDNHLALIKASWLKENGSIFITHNEWGAYRSNNNHWIILSDPRVEYLFIDPVNKTAAVYFSIGDLEMGVGYFEFINEVWTRTNLITACTDCD